MIKTLILGLLVMFTVRKCVPEPPIVAKNVNFGIISKTNAKQEYEEFFLKVADQSYNWKITEPGKRSVKRISIPKGIHQYELTVKSKIKTSAGTDLIIGTSSGTISIEKDKDLELVWDRKLKDNVYKVSLK